MYEVAKAYADEAVAFSTLKMTASLVWVPTAVAPECTFCSELCANVLLAGDMLPAALDTSKVTPSGLHRMLCDPAALALAAPPARAAAARAVAIGFR